MGFVQIWSHFWCWRRNVRLDMAARLLRWMFTYRNLCNKWSSTSYTATDAVVCTSIRWTPFHWWLSIQYFSLASIVCDVMVEVWCRASCVRVVRADAIVVKCFIFIVGRCWTLRMAIQIDCSCWALWMVMLVSSAVN